MTFRGQGKLTALVLIFVIAGFFGCGAPLQADLESVQGNQNTPSGLNATNGLTASGFGAGVATARVRVGSSDGAENAVGGSEFNGGLAIARVRVAPSDGVNNASGEGSAGNRSENGTDIRPESAAEGDSESGIEGANERPFLRTDSAVRAEP